MHIQPIEPIDIQLVRKIFSVRSTLDAPKINLCLRFFEPESPLLVFAILCSTIHHFERVEIFIDIALIDQFKSTLAPWEASGVDIYYNQNLANAAEVSYDLNIVNIGRQAESMKFSSALPGNSDVFFYCSSLQSDTNLIWTLMHEWWKIFDIHHYGTFCQDGKTLFLFRGVRLVS